MLFEKTSTRTRLSFELAIKQLGGHLLVLDSKESHYGSGNDTVYDTAKVLSQYADILMIRTDSHKIVDEFKKYLDIPIINGLTNKGHPCQVMADMMTIIEEKKSLNNLNIIWNHN